MCVTGVSNPSQAEPVCVQVFGKTFLFAIIKDSSPMTLNCFITG